MPPRALVFAATLLVAGTMVAADQPSKGLVLLADIPDNVPSAGRIEVAWRLVNRGDAPVTIALHPGVAFWRHSRDADGEDKGTSPEFPNPGTDTHDSLKTLAPGATLAGTAWLDVVATSDGWLQVYAVYRSGERVAEYGSKVWQGDVRSRTVTVAVPRISGSD